MSDHFRVISTHSHGGSIVLIAMSGDRPPTFREEEWVTIRAIEECYGDPKAVERLINKALIKVIRRVAKKMEKVLL